MRFIETELGDAYIIEPSLIEDERGFFARTFCQNEFAKQGLVTKFVQSNISFNHQRGTVRGMHYQSEPYPETKLVRCTQGSIFDIIVDLRPKSCTYLQWTGIELSAKNRKALYVPAGFAHGFQTLEEDSEILYQMSEFYRADCADGVCWNDEAIGIVWPNPITMISEKDQKFASMRIEKT